MWDILSQLQSVVIPTELQVALQKGKLTIQSIV